MTRENKSALMSTVVMAKTGKVEREAIVII